MFHVSMLCRYMPDPSHVLEPLPVELAEDLSFTTQPVAIVRTSVRQLRHRQILLVRMVWCSSRFEEELWETEEAMRQQYPFLFKTIGKNFEDKFFKEGRAVDPRPESSQFGSSTQLLVG